VIIECPQCEARVNAQKIATFDYPEQWAYDLDASEEAPPGSAETDTCPRERWTLLACRNCGQVMLASQTDAEWDGQWSEVARAFPPDEPAEFPIQIPQGIRRSLDQARRSLRGEAYDATATMCRRAIEGLCRHHSASPGLAAGLTELRKQGTIDGMLFEWAEALRLHGNIASHADPTPISKEDATDLFDFAVAICQYVLVLGEKFRKFKERASTGAQGTIAVQ
jgi:Domain of unknown function (DUF4145)